MSNIEKLLHKEIEERFSDIGKMDAGSDEYKKAVESLTKLVEKAIEIDKFNNDYVVSEKTREFEEQLKITQAVGEQRDRLVKNILTGAGIGVPALLTVWGTLKSLKFEETGTITTAIGRGFINKLLPKK